MAVSGRREKGGNPVEALPMAESRLNETEQRVQQAFMKSGFFNGLALGGVVVAAYMVLHELPDRDGRPDAALPLRYAPVTLPAAAPPLRLAGAWRMEAGDWRFGGLSALVTDRDGFLAVSDLGAVARFDPPTASSPMVRVADLRQGPGKPGKKSSRDAESIVRDPRGRGWWVGYEQHHSLWLYDEKFERAVASIRLPKLGWPANRGVEGLLAGNGSLLALRENGRQAIRIASGEAQVMNLYRSAEIADAATAPDGSAWVLLRGKGLDGIGQSVAPLHETPDGFRVGRRWPLPKAAFDNYEGMAIARRPDGRWRFWLVTDDGHRFLARTLLVALDLEVPAATHDKGPARSAGPSKPSVEQP